MKRRKEGRMGGYTVVTSGLFDMRSIIASFGGE